MAKVKELREKGAKLAQEIRTLADKLTPEHPEFSGEERAAWEKVNKEYDANKASLAIAERAETIERELATPADSAHRDVGREDLDGRHSDPPDETGRRTRPDEALEPSRSDPARADADRAEAFAAWLGYQHRDLSERQDEACRRLRFNPARRRLDLVVGGTGSVRSLARVMRSVHPSIAFERAERHLAERRDLSAITGASGAVTVPSQMVNSLELNMLAYGGMLQVADILRTEGGGDMPWPSADDTANSGEQLGENVTVGSSVDPTFKGMTLKAYKMSSKLIKCPVELLEDSAFDLAAVIGQMLGERLGRISNTKFTTGSGAGTPRGIVTASTAGKTTASATAIAADEILDLIHSVDPAYRVGAGFMFHDNILLALRKLKDGESRYLWQSGMNTGSPDTLFGYPTMINQDMASSVASAAKTMLFGRLSAYKVRQVRGIRLRRLDERYADTDQVGFIAFLREDGDLLNAGTAPVKHLLQA